MKKFKKLLAGLLTGAMLLGSMSVSAFASDTTPTSTSVPVIDKSKKGSITIHKYTEGTTTGTAASGKNNATVPAGAAPIKDVGFTIYQVADVDDLTNYYSTNPTSLPNATSYYTGTGKNVRVNADAKKVGSEVKTDVNGVATFENLALGIYLVVETTSPEIVTRPREPFLVAVPMTIDGDDWLYNVHVYPKNTVVGGVSLVKTGKGGAKLEGVTFVLQKQNDDATWTNIIKKSTAAGDNTGADLTLVTNTEGQINVDGLSSGTYRFIETDRGDNGGYIMDGATAYQFTVGADGKVTYHSDSADSDSAAADTTIDVKNEKPDITKEVQKDTGWDHIADYSVGDLVPYHIKVSVPANITKLKTFTLTDTPKNLDDKIESVVIKYGETEIPKNDVYTVKKAGNDNHGFEITFDPTKMSAYAGKEIIVTYNAELLDTAVTTTAGNTNAASLEYSNKILPDSTDPDNPNTPTTPVTPGTDKITDTTYVYTFGIQIVKKAESESGTPLENVEFDLYKAVDEGTKGAATADEVKKAGLDSKKTWMKINTASLVTKKDGTVSQSGLKNGEYYLVETKTNETYNLLKEPVKVTLKIDYAITTGTTTTTDSDGNVTIVKEPVTKTTFNNDESKTDGIQIQTVINKKGFTLPLTGGMGTVLFSVIGLALVLAGVVVITASRKKTAK